MNRIRNTQEVKKRRLIASFESVKNIEIKREPINACYVIEKYDYPSLGEFLFERKVLGRINDQKIL